MRKRCDHEPYSATIQMTDKYMKDAYNERNEQQNNEIPIAWGGKVEWYLLLVKVQGNKGSCIPLMKV